jgi:GT2 family glycosyltransferase
MRIIALATCHNRRQLTLKALDAIRRQILPSGAKVQICLVDDGSTDGTGEAVRASFPEVVVLHGSGDLFWAGGMRLGWEKYVSSQQADYLLVFNDDIEVSSRALETLLQAAAELESKGRFAYAVAGALIHPETGEPSYGGVVRSSWWHPLRFAKLAPSEAIQRCDTVNMNFTLISRGALQLIGFLSPEFVHGGADYDFGLRLRASGGCVVLAPGSVGTCHTNPLSGKSLAPDLSFSERWQRLTGIKEQAPRIRAVYYRRHAGWLWPCFWILPYVRACVGSAAGFMTKAVRGLRVG